MGTLPVRLRGEGLAGEVKQREGPLARVGLDRAELELSATAARRGQTQAAEFGTMRRDASGCIGRVVGQVMLPVSLAGAGRRAGGWRGIGRSSARSGRRASLGRP